LTIFATVVREVVVEPASLVTRLTGLKKTVEFSMKARNQSAKPVTLRLSSIQGSLTRAVMKPDEVTIAQGSESRFRVRMELTGKGNPHYFRGRLILETNHPGEKWIGLPYFIKVDSAR
jgi:hypothetical protein